MNEKRTPLEPQSETPSGDLSQLNLRLGESPWQVSLRRLRKDKLAIACFFVVLVYVVIAVLSALGWVGDWKTPVGASYAHPSSEKLSLFFGTDLFGRSVLAKTLHGIEVALRVGLLASLIALPFGVILGTLAGYFGGWFDRFVVWLYTTLSSIPNIMLLIAITYALGKGFSAVCVALAVTSWVSLARVLRGEVMKHRTRDYVIAAASLGASHWSRMFKHILPNVMHFVILSFSIQFMTAIKAEVVLSFLGIGIQGEPSWGTMIDDSKMEISRGVWWQLAAAAGAMFIVLLAFNVVGDALRDAFDPKGKQER